MRQPIITLAAAVAAALVAVVPMAQAGPSAGRTLEPTRFGFSGHGYGSRISGGQVPANSGATAYQVIGCTNLAGRDAGNHQARVTVPGLGTLSGLETHVHTVKNNGVFASVTRNTVTRVHASGMGGSVNINAIDSRSRAYHDDHGFHATATTTVGSIRFVPPGGLPAQTIPVPSPGQSINIPGVATIYVGLTKTSHGAHGALARADGLRVVSQATGSQAKVARAVARINDGIKSGVFNGFEAAARARGLAQVGGIGYTPLQKMPCQGTRGQVHTRAIANVNLGGQLVLGALTDKEKASQSATRAHGFAQASVASVNLGGQVKATGIVGRVTITRKGSHVTRSIKGSTIGSLTVNGATQTFPASGVITIPGLVKLERNVRTRYPSGLRLIALRITVLDGSGGVVDLGQARLRINSSHR